MPRKPKKARNSRAPRGLPEPFQIATGRKAGYWCVSVELPPSPDGKRRRQQVTAKTRDDCTRKRDDLLAQLDAPPTVEPDPLTVGEWLDRWLSETVALNREDLTWQGYRTVIRHHLKPQLGAIRLADLTPDRIQAYYADRRRNGRLVKVGKNGHQYPPGLSAQTVKSHHQVLHAALEQAVRFRKIPYNPDSLTDKPSAPRYEAQFLTTAQAQHFLETVRARRERLEALFVLVLTTGLRAGEVFGIRWSDIDFVNGRLAIRQTVNRKRKGDPIGATKTHRSRRPIPLVPLALAALQTHRARQADERATAERWAASDLVFTTRTGTPLSGSNFTKRDWWRLVAAGGLPEGFRFHDLRHSAGSFLLGQRVPLKVVSELLGHSAIGITADIYSHVAESLQAEAADAMGRLFPAQTDD